jgi:Glycosyltransferase family 87
VEHAFIARRSAKAFLQSSENLLRLGLLAGALLLNLVPIYQFVGSMIWFHHYLGDYQVFWGITKIPLDQIYGHRVFAYPPTALMLFSPFGLLPFWPSLAAWSSVGMAAITCAARRLMPPLAIALGLITYAGVGVVLGGQISLFMGALIIGALSSDRPWCRGLLLAAAAVIKPQSLLAAPIILLAERNWKAIGWAMAAGCGLLLSSVLLLGPDLWLRWLAELPKFHAYLISRGVDRMDVGIYGMARSFGLPGWTFLFAAPLGIATSWLVFRNGSATTLDRYAAFAASTVLMSPYTLYYDLAGLTFAGAALLLDRKRSPLIWLAAAMIVSSIFASYGIVLLAAILCLEAFASRTDSSKDEDSSGRAVARLRA